MLYSTPVYVMGEPDIPLGNTSSRSSRQLWATARYLLAGHVTFVTFVTTVTSSRPYGCTVTGAFGSSPNISGAYIASTRVGGNSKRPGLFRRTVYSTTQLPLGTKR